MIIVHRDIKTFLYFSVDNIRIVFFYNGIGNQNLRGESIDIICVKESEALKIHNSTAFCSIAGSVRDIFILEDFEPFYAYLENMTLTSQDQWHGVEYDKEKRIKLVKRWFTRISKIDRLLGE